MGATAKKQVGLSLLTNESTMYFCTNCDMETRHRDPIPKLGAAICQICGTKNKIPWLPLFVVTGGGGCGKTTVARGLLRKPDLYFVLEADKFQPLRKCVDSNAS